MTNRILLTLAIVPLLALLASCGGDDGPTPTPAVLEGDEVTIDIPDFEFDPPNATVGVGTKVTWVNHHNSPHDATDNDGDWETKRLNDGDSDTVTFDEAGTYDYHCSVHPYMKGTITVGPTGD